MSSVQESGGIKLMLPTRNFTFMAYLASSSDGCCAEDFKERVDADSDAVSPALPAV